MFQTELETGEIGGTTQGATAQVRVWAAWILGVLVIVAAQIGASMGASSDPDDAVHRHVVFAIWATTILLIPALSTFILMRPGPSEAYWRAFWTLSYVALVVHLYWAVGFACHGSLWEVFHSSGGAATGPCRVDHPYTDTFLALWWGVDVVLLWLVSGASGLIRLERSAVHVLAFAMFFGATVLAPKAGATSLGLGLVMTAVVIASVGARLVRPRTDVFGPTLGHTTPQVAHPEKAAIPPTPPLGNVGVPRPVLDPSNGLWRPRSARVGITPVTYIWWNWFYAVMEFFNRKLARDPNRKVSWDTWPSFLGLLYLLAKLRFNRSNALTDPYDYVTNDNDRPSPAPVESRWAIGADGRWVSDEQNGQMGAAMTRFGSNIAPRRVRPDVEKMEPSARKVSQRLRARLTDADDREIVIPALILNGAAAGWIQFQFHNFGGNTLRDPINRDPYRLRRDPADGWPGNVAFVDRTTQDPTRVKHDERPTPINEKVHAWVQGQLYGNNQMEQDRLRSFTGGKLAVAENGFLLEDPSRPGVDLTGYSNNYNPHLSFLHWLFTMEHNAIAEYLASFHADWDDEILFQMARKTNCAQIARIHTIEWTEDLLQHPTLQLGMHADYYGLLGQRLKCYLMRLSNRHVAVERLLKPFRGNDFIWGMPGGTWEHHDGPFQVPKHFRLVYRLHEMILGEYEIVCPDSGELLGRVPLIGFVHHNTRQQVQRYGYDALGWSFVSKSCGALTLHNFPRALTCFQRMQDKNLIDLAELDIFREREDGTGTYNDLRRSLGEPPVTSFLELTGGNAGLARELEIVYEGEVDRVDAGIGILAEPKPAGFALGFVQFYQFVLNAPRRVKSNRFLSEGYNYREYQEGLNWVEHAGGFKGAIGRHLPKLGAKLEGVKRGFAPWPDTETFPERLLTESQNDIGRAFRADLRTLAVGLLSGAMVAWWKPAAWWVVILAVSVLFAGSVAVGLTRLLARRFLQECEKKCYTDRRRDMFGTLYRGERRIRWASLGGHIGAATVMLVAASGAVLLWGSAPWLSALLALPVLSSVSTLRWSRRFTQHASVLKVALRNRMRAGAAPVDAHTSGEPISDEPEVSQLFRRYAPGRDHFTAYDFARLNEGERTRGRDESGGNSMGHALRAWSGPWRRRRLLHAFADLVVEEDRKLVPAISRDMLRRVYHGTAQEELDRERQQRVRL